MSLISDRTALNAYLKSVCPNVFYQPGKNVTLTYPCITYTDSTVERFDANNHVYNSFMGYQITVITRDADSQIAKEIMKTWPNTDYSNSFVTDNLYHTVLMAYTLY